MICESCQACIDFMGTPCLPQYGLPPHESFDVVHGEFKIVQSRIRPKEEWPDNFVPDPQEPNAGGMWYCATKGCENSKELYRDEWSKPNA